MKAFLALTVLLGLSMTTEALLFDDISCAILPAVCASKLEGITAQSTCSEKRPYFTCLHDNNCKSGTVYQAQVTAYDYSQCSGTALLMSTTLLAVMTILAKFMSN